MDEGGEIALSSEMDTIDPLELLAELRVVGRMGAWRMVATASTDLGTYFDSTGGGFLGINSSESIKWFNISHGSGDGDL